MSDQLNRNFNLPLNQGGHYWLCFYATHGSMPDIVSNVLIACGAKGTRGWVCVSYGRKNGKCSGMLCMML